MGRILSLDIGEKRTGIGITDSERIIATPLEGVLTSNLMERLKELLREYDDIDFILIGMPYNMDGTMSDYAEFVKKMGEEIKKIKDVVYYDERLTSWEAERMVGGKEARNNKKKIDSLAAAILLESYLRENNV